MCVCWCEFLCAPEHEGTHRGQRAPDPLELELQSVVSPPGWGLGTQSRFSARAVTGLQRSALSPALTCLSHAVFSNIYCNSTVL